MNTIQYKGYLGKFDYDPEADIFHGEVINLKDVITFQGRSIDELKTALAESVEDYLDFCREEDEEPEKPYSGKIHLRLKPELHREAASAAAISGKSLNAWISDTLTERVKEIR
ncbi:type II toxin-antitoxin system HicB family antitoxin [Desulfovibrio sp. JC010]|uniref:type II toxin-antitoxin system HicB family antitoxin n=1 Tax=Desulfovibrio sp. JC010 TaxID=2593641 RepID=UPI0013CFD221|nr:type II toxin-antitoxin system HicB family antitoxin [Desulfovibrio sp. JC010]NDV27219.1 type II toxin-antitoxin system HicB family antitoxin [Desulfovibrio sp. JC010]